MQLFFLLLLGDAGYPLTPYLITPFRSTQENSPQARFNKNHTQARIIIEQTIGLLKNRFRCLLGARELHYTPQKATKIINVCAALHNISQYHGIELDEVIENQELDDDPYENENIPNNDRRNVGEIVRNELLNTIL